MRHDTHRHDHRHPDHVDATRGATAGTLARLDELDDYEVAGGYPDPRGWDVKTTDGRTVGTVKNLLVDRAAMRVRYLDVELKPEFRGDGASNGRVHVPVAQARLDDARDDVHVALDPTALGGLGAADPDRFDATDARHDDARFFGGRVDAERAGNAYLTLHEERLAVGKRATSAGEVEVRKRVEAESVRETVPLTREEVTIERRPLDGDDARRAAGNATIDADGAEIRVAVMAEEVVVEKRVVPVEEVVIRKTAHTEQQVVEDTVRRERVDIDRGGLDHDRTDR